ncbi:MAG: hypothetical protein RL662_74 [Bacteroidota bacterium]
MEKKILSKYIFIILAIVIGISFLLVSNRIADDLAEEERLKIELWATALEMAASVEDGGELNLTLKILSANKTIPVILCDSLDNVLLTANIDINENDSVAFLQKKLREFKKNRTPIIVENPNFKQYVYYSDSYTLIRLQYYPFVQIGILTIFVCVAFLALLSTKNEEQNKVWVGLSKETAHQLGTPISSMLAWLEYLKTKMTNLSVINEMEKDVTRLQIVADRFSKIGSTPSPRPTELQHEIMDAIGYLDKRISKKVVFVFDMPNAPLYANISTSLFSWVIENLVKNAVDSMLGVGQITCTLSQDQEKIYFDITDTGKGIQKSMFKEIFSPGFTTKQRGWGLGLSLTKRIIEDYHKGRIYVKRSELGVGTTFRIELKATVI